MGEPNANQREWIIRVLGIAPPAGGQAAALLEAVRPNETPASPMTSNFLAALGRVSANAAEELPAILSGMIPRFLLTVQSEPSMDAQPMVEGASIAAQDQLLVVADSLNAALRSARRWEALLDQAESANREIDEMEAAERGVAQQEGYAETVASYNATRLEALAEQARCQALVETLATEFRAAQGAAAQ